MSADHVRIWNHADMSNKVVRLPERLPLGCMSPWPICLGSHEAVFECSWFKSSETDTPSFNEKKSWQCQQQSFLELSGFIDQISITVCAKPLPQVMFTILKTKKILRKPGNLRVLRNCVCLVTWASAACIVSVQRRTYANRQQWRCQAWHTWHTFCLYTKLHALWLLDTLYLVSSPATEETNDNKSTQTLTWLGLC